jgi:hypothetical protein
VRTFSNRRNRSERTSIGKYDRRIGSHVADQWRQVVGTTFNRGMTDLYRQFLLGNDIVDVLVPQQGNRAEGEMWR